jgi:hypothetical protein
MIPVETIAQMGRGEMKETREGGELKHDIFDTL